LGPGKTLTEIAEWQAGVQTYNKIVEKIRRVEYAPTFRLRDIS